MNLITISNKEFAGDDLVVISKKQYDFMSANLPPQVYLKGKAARRLDRRATSALREYKIGKTRKVSSLREL